jgi:hypothetical protein
LNEQHLKTFHCFLSLQIDSQEKLSNIETELQSSTSKQVPFSNISLPETNSQQPIGSEISYVTRTRLEFDLHDDENPTQTLASKQAPLNDISLPPIPETNSQQLIGSEISPITQSRSSILEFDLHDERNDENSTRTFSSSKLIILLRYQYIDIDSLFNDSI